MEQTTTLITFGLFLILFLGIGALAAKSAKNNEDDYILGGRSFGALFIGLSAGATGNSGFIMVGMVGFAYSVGISAIWLPIAVFFGDWIFWTFLAEKVHQFSIETESQTVPELLGSACKVRSWQKRFISSVVALITIILVGAYAVGQFAAAGKALNSFFDISYELGVILSVFAILSYCITGGLRASIWTDVVQAFIVILITFGMLAFSIIKIGGVNEAALQLASIEPDSLNLFLNLRGDKFFAYFLGFTVLGLGFGLSQPPIIARILAGKNEKEVRKARWIYLTYTYSTWIAMTLFGLVCRALIPEIQDPEQALPILATQNFHPVLIGIVLAGMFSVIASTADSQILSCSSALARDLSPRAHVYFGRSFGVRYHQFSTIFIGLLTLLATLFLANSVFQIIIFAIGILAGSLAPVTLIAVLRRKTNVYALSITMLLGASSAVTWQLLGLSSYINEAVPAIIIGLLSHEISLLFIKPEPKESQ